MGPPCIELAGETSSSREAQLEQRHGDRTAEPEAVFHPRGSHRGQSWEGAEARQWIRPSLSQLPPLNHRQRGPGLAKLPGMKCDIEPWGTEGMTWALLLAS